MFSISESIFVLSIHEVKGKVIASVKDCLPLGLVGAMFCDLAIQGKIRANQNHRLELIDQAPTGFKIQDDILARISKSDHLHKFSFWVEEIAEKQRKMDESIEKSLVDQGIFTREEKHLTWNIPSPAFPEVNGSARTALKEHLRKIGLASQAPALSDLALLNIIKSCGLMDVVFFKDEQNLVRSRIRELIVSEALGNSTAQTIEEIGSAIELNIEEE